MANPPYSGCVIVLEEGPDGIAAEVFCWDEVVSGTPIPPLPPALAHSMMQANPTFRAIRMCGTRTALKNVFGGFLDQHFSDTPA